MLYSISCHLDELDLCTALAGVTILVILFSSLLLVPDDTNSFWCMLAIVAGLHIVFLILVRLNHFYFVDVHTKLICSSFVFWN
jgi:hypothetical protein